MFQSYIVRKSRQELIVLHPPTANSREHRQTPSQACCLQPGSLSLLAQSSGLSSWRGAIHTQGRSLHLNQRSRESPITMPTGQPDLCNSESLFCVILNSSKFIFKTKQQSWQVSCHVPHHAGTHAGLKFPFPIRSSEKLQDFGFGATWEVSSCFETQSLLCFIPLTVLLA